MIPIGQVSRLDAGYFFTRDGGATFPFRGAGVTVPTFAEVCTNDSILSFSVSLYLSLRLSLSFSVAVSLSLCLGVLLQGVHERLL